jgi:hypothetical protein
MKKALLTPGFFPCGELTADDLVDDIAAANDDGNANQERNDQEGHLSTPSGFIILAPAQRGVVTNRSRLQ